MSYAPSYKKGDWLAICDRCGFKYKASRLKKTWDNFMVCHGCFEPRHPLDMLRAVKDDPSVPWTRPESADVETDISSWEPPTGVIPPGTFDNSL